MPLYRRKNGQVYQHPEPLSPSHEPVRFEESRPSVVYSEAEAKAAKLKWDELEVEYI